VPAERFRCDILPRAEDAEQIGQLADRVLSLQQDCRGSPIAAGWDPSKVRVHKVIMRTKSTAG
jgi:hypothetical protein